MEKLFGAALNLLMPGLGHVYAQQVRRGIVLFFFLYALLIARRFFAFNFTLFVIWIVALVIKYLYIVVQGYRAVGRPKTVRNSILDKPFVYAIVIVIVTLGTFAAASHSKMNVLAPVSFFRIPTVAMEPGLEIGDHIGVKRTKTVSRGDMAVFWFKGDVAPFDVETTFVKRCIGLPGDSVEIIKGSVKINGVFLPKIPLKFSYNVKTDGTVLSKRFFDNLHMLEYDYYRLPENNYQMFLSTEQVDVLKKFPFIKEVSIFMTSQGESSSGIYGNTDWNTDYFGPLYVPKKGDKISLTKENIKLYLKWIIQENKSVEHSSMGIKINGERTAEYIFKENYYFMMGDNRHNSHDSRYWGFVPESRLIGQAMYIYWSPVADRIGTDLSAPLSGWDIK